MKYFTQGDSEGKDWASLNKAQREALDRKLLRNHKAYQKQLNKLQGRISRQAWNFFAFGFGGWGLCDARLMSLSVGDGLDLLANDGNHLFTVKRQKTQVRILNRKQTFMYSFVCTGIRRMVFAYPLQDPRWDWGQIDLLETYELTSVNKRYLSLEFSFSSNVALLVEFARLKFKLQRVYSD